MYITSLAVSDYRGNDRLFECNAAWISIRQDGKVIFSRRADDTGTGQWFDERHKRIYEAMKALEAAILEAPDEAAQDVRDTKG